MPQSPGFFAPREDCGAQGISGFQRRIHPRAEVAKGDFATRGLCVWLRRSLVATTTCAGPSVSRSENTGVILFIARRSPRRPWGYDLFVVLRAPEFTPPRRALSAVEHRPLRLRVSSSPGCTCRRAYGTSECAYYGAVPARRSGSSGADLRSATAHNQKSKIENRKFPRGYAALGPPPTLWFGGAKSELSRIFPMEQAELLADQRRPTGQSQPFRAFILVGQGQNRRDALILREQTPQ